MKGASGLAPHKGKALKKEIRRAEKASRDLDTSIASSSKNTQPLRGPKRWPTRCPLPKLGGQYSKFNNPTGVRANIEKIDEGEKISESQSRPFTTGFDTQHQGGKDGHARGLDGESRNFLQTGTALESRIQAGLQPSFSIVYFSSGHRYD